MGNLTNMVILWKEKCKKMRTQHDINALVGSKTDRFCHFDIFCQFIFWYFWDPQIDRICQNAHLECSPIIFDFQSSIQGSTTLQISTTVIVVFSQYFRNFWPDLKQIQELVARYSLVILDVSRWMIRAGGLHGNSFPSIAAFRACFLCRLRGVANK